MDNGGLIRTRRGTIDENNVPERIGYIELLSRVFYRIAITPESEILTLIRNEYQKKKKRDEVVILLC